MPTNYLNDEPTMKISCFFLSFTFLAFYAEDATAWTLLKKDEPVEQPTTDSEPTAELSLVSEFLSVLEYGLVCFTETVQVWQKQVVECEEVQRQMDTAMETYKISRKQDDAVQVLNLIDTIFDFDAPCFDATASAYTNAVFIARDKTGLSNQHDNPDKPFEINTEPSKSYKFGRKLGSFIKRLLQSKGVDLPIINF